MAMKSKAKGGGAVSMNMTPMIDVVFQLIIFFMLVVQFYRLTTEDVLLPPASKADPKRKEIQQYSQLVVNVVPPMTAEDKRAKRTKVVIDRKVIVESIEGGDVPDWDPLIALLKARKESAEQKGLKPVNVILRAGANVPYETIGSIMICVSRAGVKYWWVQAFRPKSPSDDALLREIGAPTGQQGV